MISCGANGRMSKQTNKRTNERTNTHNSNRIEQGRKCEHTHTHSYRPHRVLKCGQKAATNWSGIRFCFDFYWCDKSMRINSGLIGTRRTSLALKRALRLIQWLKWFAQMLVLHLIGWRANAHLSSSSSCLPRHTRTVSHCALESTMCNSQINHTSMNHNRVFAKQQSCIWHVRAIHRRWKSGK